MVNKTLIILWISAAILITALLSFYFSLPYIYRFHFTSSSSYTTACNYTEIEDVIGCLVNEVNTWAEYNLSNVNTYLPDEELKEQGGVCWHYAEWYAKELKARGFEARTESFQPNKEWSGHRITLASNYNRSTYCIIDQRSFNCHRLVPVSIDSLNSYNKSI